MRALISVFDKENIVEFARALVSMDWEIISTGGTLALLEKEKIPVMAVEEVTGFPEILDGRVKTLHPAIHAGILYRRENAEHQKTMDEKNLSSIDMVVNNLYPFEKTLQQTDDAEQIIEMIDIGGPSMIRAAAKNYRDVLIVTKPSDYREVIDRLKNNTIDETYRHTLAMRAFQITAAYDRAISAYFSGKEVFALDYRNGEPLRYGENPHQQAKFFENTNLKEEEKAQMRQLHGKQLSYNNYIDMYAAVKAVKTFKDCACVAIKHTNPCGIAVGETTLEAYEKAYACDSESIFGGIVAFNREVEEQTANRMAEIFLEIIIAPKFSEKALEKLEQKKNIRLMEIENLEDFQIEQHQIKQVLNGLLVQDYDDVDYHEETLRCVTKRQPTVEEKKNLLFAWNAVRSVGSNGVVVTKNRATVGIGQSETKRSWAVEEALNRAGEQCQDAVMASDGFFFRDTMELLHENGIRAVIQPGGSIHDEEVIEYADAHDMTVLFTGIRHFRHS